MSRALVIGGGIAGMAVAKILCQFYDCVTILEKDAIESSRRGVPQSDQPHVLLSKGYQLLCDWFPGLQEGLLKAGAIPINWGLDFRLYSQKDWSSANHFNSALLSVSCTRTLLEQCIRAELNKFSKVTVIQGYQVVNFIQATTLRLGGVRAVSKKTNLIEVIKADIIVDCSGRSSRTPEWLKSIGYSNPPEVIVDPGLGYSTILFDCAGYSFPWKVLAVSEIGEKRDRIGYLAHIEGERLIATIGSHRRQYPPINLDEYMNFAKNLVHPIFFDVISKLNPVSSVHAFRNTANRRRFYEKIEMPENLFVLGDAICAFCPVHGQGISVSALSAKLLEDWMFWTKINPFASKKSQDFYVKLTEAIDMSWNQATALDSPFTSNESIFADPLSYFIRLFNERLTRKLIDDPIVFQKSVGIHQLVDHPLFLLDPMLLLRIFS